MLLPNQCFAMMGKTKDAVRTSMGIAAEDITRELEKRHVVDHKMKQERMK